MSNTEITTNSTKDAQSFEIFKSFGFNDADAFAFAMQTPIKVEEDAEDVIRFFEEVAK
jgi:hypothetical protein